MAFLPFRPFGTPRVITNEAGEITATHKYYPYGEEITSQTQNTLNHKFTGHERDLKSNLDYMHARYYHQFIGRFLSVDPIKFSHAVTVEKWNDYFYSLNNPMKYLDPNGRDVIYADSYTNEYVQKARKVSPKVNKVISSFESKKVIPPKKDDNKDKDKNKDGDNEKKT